MEHAERVGGRARHHTRDARGRYPEAALGELRFGFRGYDDHGAQRPADRSHIRDLETQAGQRIETGPPRDRHLDDAELCSGRGGPAGPEQL